VAGASTTVSPVAAVGLLGREVLIAGDSFQWTAGVSDPDPATDSLTGAKPARLGFELPAAASAVRIEILDAAGQVVHTHELADVEAGVHSYEWNGQDADGKAAGDGKYRLRAIAATYYSTEMSVETLVPARVTGVAQAPGGARVELGGRPAQAASSIRAIL
jgi:flagellar basal-body rod modification protein FlgD